MQRRVIVGSGVKVLNTVSLLPAAPDIGSCPIYGAVISVCDQVTPELLKLLFVLVLFREHLEIQQNTEVVGVEAL